MRQKNDLSSRAGQASIPLSLYLHFPWCVHKCPYCDFNSHTLRDELPETEYVDALLRDLDYELRLPSPVSRLPPLGSIFMGGGTPSLFSDRAIGRLLEGVNRRLAFAPDIEITLEANPGTVDAGHFRGYRAAGVNRLSVGVQSLNDTHLRRLGRIHDRRAALQAVETARSAGFENLNLDLMYALPEQTLAEAAADLGTALSLAPEHLSYYQLTLEPNTEFAAHPPPLPDEDAAWDLHQQGHALLADAGFAQYEISAFARGARRARHNLNYWTYGDYLGIGAGAHGKHSALLADGSLAIVRRARHKHPRSYLQHAGSATAVQSEQAVAPAERPLDFLLFALRLNQPFDKQTFCTRTGLDWQAHAPAVQRALAQGLLRDTGEAVGATEKGRDHLNRLLGLFLADDAWPSADTPTGVLAKGSQAQGTGVP